MAHKLASRTVLMLLIAACGYIGGILTTRTPARYAGVQAADTRPDVWEHVPEVDGQIGDCLPSPDHSRIAILYGKRTTVSVIPTIAILDPSERRLLGQINPSVGAPSAPWTWSPDSKWLTIPEEENKITMISRDGQVRVLPTGKVAADVVWREGQPGKLLYTNCTPYVYEYDLATGEERPIRTGFKYAEWLFSVNGNPCVAGIDKSGSTRSMRVCLVDGGETTLSVTAPAGYSSVRSLEQSPDGRFVAMVCENPRAIGIVARTQDLPSVLRDRPRALLVEDLCSPIFRVTWPSKNGDSCGIINGHTVDLTDGCLNYRYPNMTRMADWTAVTKNGKRMTRWLGVGKFGLTVFTPDEWQSSPLLAHTANDDD